MIFFLVCENPVSIAIIVDASSSINSVKHKKILEFVQRLTDSFVVGKDKTHFAMTQFSFYAKVEFTFANKEYWNPVKLKEKIQKAEMIYGKGFSSLFYILIHILIFLNL